MLALTQLAGFGGGGGGPIVVTVDGSAQDNATANNQIYTVVGTIPVGSLVVVLGSNFSNASNGNGVSDTGGNNWTKQNGNQSSTNHAGAIYSSITTTALSPGNTITLSWQSMVTGHVMAVAWAANISSNTIDGAAKTSGTSTTPSVTTGALAQANEVAFGLVAANTNVVATQDAAFTTIANITYAGTNGRFIAGYQIVSSAAAVTYAPTLATSQNWLEMLDTWKGF